MFMKISKTMKIAAAVLLVQSFLIPTAALAQSQDDINAAIRKEGMERSKAMNTLHYFTDHFGPRLTGSPSHVAFLQIGRFVR